MRQLPAITGQGPRYIPVPGPTGPTGQTGPQGAATAVSIDGVDVLSPGTDPTVTDTDPGPDVALRFGLPSGGVTWSQLVDGTVEAFTFRDITKGTIVEHAGKLYIAVRDVPGSGSLVPESHPDYWQQLVLNDHALTIDDLVHAAPEDYLDASGYNEGAVVLFQGAYWVAKKDTQAGQSPVTNAGAWLSLDLDDIARKAQNAAAHGLPSGGTPGQGIVKTGPQPDDVTWAYLLPPVSGHAAGDALTIADPATGQMDWAAVARLARTPNPATGDLGLPGFAGSDTGWRDVTADLLVGNGWVAGAASVS